MFGFFRKTIEKASAYEVEAPAAEKMDADQFGEWLSQFKRTLVGTPSGNRYSLANDKFEWAALVGYDLSRVDFSRFDIRGVQFRKCIMNRCEFDNKLSGTEFIDCDMRWSVFENVDLHKAIFTNVNLDNVTFKNSWIRSETIGLALCSAREARFISCRFGRKDILPGDMSGVRMHLCNMRPLSMMHAAKLSGCEVIKGCDMSAALERELKRRWIV